MAEAAKAESGMFHRLCHFAPSPSGERGRGFQMTGIVDVENGPKSRVAYGAGMNVWIREVEDPTQAFYYRGHKYPVSCARWAPFAIKDKGGGYIVTGDLGGNWRVWTCRANGPVTKGHAEDGFGFKCAKEVRDVSWQGDGKKCVIVGFGKEELGKCASWDAGNQFGVFDDIKTTLLTCDTTMERPYRAMTAGEAGIVYLYKSEGGVMKYVQQKKVSRKYLNCLRFHRSGEYAIAVGSDGGKIHVVNGRTCEEIATIKTKTKGTNYSVAWNPEGTHFAVSGAHKKIMIFKIDLPMDIKKEKVKRRTITTVEFGECNCEKVAEYTVGDQIDDQQNSIAWPKSDTIVSSSIWGDLTYVSPEGKLLRTVSGHDKCVDSMEVSPGADGSIYTCSSTKVIVFSMKEKTARRYRGHHGVVGRATPAPYRMIGLSCDHATLVTVAMNDTIIWTPVEEANLNEASKKPTGGACRWLCCGKSRKDLTIIFGRHDGIQVFLSGESVSKTSVNYDTRAADLYSDDSVLVVSAVKDERSNEVFFVKYKVNEDGSLEEFARTDPIPQEVNSIVLKMKLNPSDNNQAAVVFGSNTRCYVVDTTTLKCLTASTINCLGTTNLRDIDWRPGSNRMLASVGSLSSIAIIKKDTTREPILATREELNVVEAHLSTCKSVRWMTDEILAIADEEGAVAVWTKTEPIGPDE